MRLAVVMTYGGSLRIWREAGIFERELALYREHAAHGAEVDLISFGGPEDLDFAAPFDFIRVHCNATCLHPRMYAWMIPWLHRSVLRRADVLKTNQTYGAHVAARCGRLWRKPLVVRQGYGHYEHRLAESGQDSTAARRALAYEKAAFSAADAVVFTTQPLAERAQARHALDPAAVSVIPNYIVPEAWSPPHRPPPAENRTRLLFFGRFTEQKNLDRLLEASTGEAVDLTLIGEGPLEEELRAAAQRLGARCCFLGRMEQSTLRETMRAHDAFILPSAYEGHPKSLLEVMAFGMPVIGAASPGVKEHIRDGETGLLAEPEPEGLRKAMRRFAALDADARASMGVAARAWSLQNFSLGEVAERERTLLASLCK